MDSIKIETKLKADGYAITHIGGRSENQDSCYYIDSPLGLVVTVCDGMGGMNGGRKASSLAVTAILNTFKEASEDSSRNVVAVNAIKAANDAILEFSESNPDFAGMGTTATVVVISDKSAIMAHVGDSRIYQLRRRKKVFRTFDHSVVFELVRKKILTEEQARLSEQSNVITRALGAKHSKDLIVDVVERSYEKGDRFLLCTDGFWGMFPEKEFLRLIFRKKGISLHEQMEQVAQIIDDEGNAKGGGHDNLTAAFIDVKQNSILKDKFCLLGRRVLTFAVCVAIVFVIAVLAMKFYPSLLNKIQSVIKAILK